jgi:hypothetical protein
MIILTPVRYPFASVKVSLFSTYLKFVLNIDHTHNPGNEVFRWMCAAPFINLGGIGVTRRRLTGGI